MKKWGAVGGERDGEKDCEIVPGKLACEPNTGSLKSTAYCWLSMGTKLFCPSDAVLTRMCTHSAHSLIPPCLIPSLFATFDWHFVKQHH